MMDRGGDRQRSESLQGGDTHEARAVDRAVVAVYLSEKLAMSWGRRFDQL
jgi:hypothetical protein